MILVDRPMPESCEVCPCMYDYIQCKALKDNEHESLSAVDDYTKRQEWCPLKEVVMCKDCKNSECVGRFGDIVCGRTGTPHRPEWYCPCGEPKDKP